MEINQQMIVVLIIMICLSLFTIFINILLHKKTKIYITGENVVAGKNTTASTTSTSNSGSNFQSFTIRPGIGSTEFLELNNDATGFSFRFVTTYEPVIEDDQEIEEQTVQEPVETPEQETETQKKKLRFFLEE